MFCHPGNRMVDHLGGQVKKAPAGKLAGVFLCLLELRKTPLQPEGQRGDGHAAKLAGSRIRAMYSQLAGTSFTAASIEDASH